MDAWKDITSRLNKNALLQKASLLSGDAPCEFDGPPICRDKWLIFRIRFAANQNSWAARIPKDQEYSFRDISIKPLEVIARRHPRIRAPRLHGYFDAGTAGDNPIGVAYMLVDWIEGKSMQPWTKDHPPTHVRQNFLRQLADITWEMLSDPIDGEDILFYG
jgi:aminoglycoside phosphotransferase (APT) family kinase protein